MRRNQSELRHFLSLVFFTFLYMPSLDCSEPYGEVRGQFIFHVKKSPLLLHLITSSMIRIVISPFHILYVVSGYPFKLPSEFVRIESTIIYLANIQCIS